MRRENIPSTTWPATRQGTGETSARTLTQTPASFSLNWALSSTSRIRCFSIPAPLSRMNPAVPSYYPLFISCTPKC
jgi:hypothetical protein